MRELLRRIRRPFLWALVLVMPVGVELDPEHPGELTVGAHGGTGQVVTVLRDCSGNVIDSERSDYQDYALSAQFSHRFDSGNRIVVGLRAGELSSTAHFPNGPEEPPSSLYMEHRYLNPHLAFESHYIGIGFGYLGDSIPLYFDDPDEHLPYTGHLRLGLEERIHFLVSVNENLPRISGGGPIVLGVDYPAGGSLRMFSGVSAGFYESLGLVQKISVRLSDPFTLDLNLRGGWVEQDFEGGVSIGLSFRVGVY